MATTVYMHTLGCPKNRVDSEVMLGQLASAGFRLVPEPTTGRLAWLAARVALRHVQGDPLKSDEALGSSRVL